MVWFAFLAVVAALRATTVYALTRAVVAAVVVATHVALVPTVPTVEDEKTFLQFFLLMQRPFHHTSPLSPDHPYPAHRPPLAEDKALLPRPPRALGREARLRVAGGRPGSARGR